MGDSRRFRLFADLISQRFPDRGLRLADVAAGKGLLKAALFQLGYRRVTCWDRRRKLAKARPGQRYQLFDYRLAPPAYQLVVAMHPDEATDHTVLYALKHKVPFVVCPCCILPSATIYTGLRSFKSWNSFVAGLARNAGFLVDELSLCMSGRNVVLLGRPVRRRN